MLTSIYKKVYIVMSCLCDFLKLTIADRPGCNSYMSDRVITGERDVRFVALSKKEMSCGML